MTFIVCRKQAILWAEGDSVRAREMAKHQHKSDKTAKAEKIAKAEKMEKQAWIDKLERQEKLYGGRMMDPLEAHMLRKITAGVDMIMTGKHKEYLEDEVSECVRTRGLWRCEDGELVIVDV